MVIVLAGPGRTYFSSNGTWIFKHVIRRAAGRTALAGEPVWAVWNIRVKNPNQFYIARKTRATARQNYQKSQVYLRLSKLGFYALERFKLVAKKLLKLKTHGFAGLAKFSGILDTADGEAAELIVVIRTWAEMRTVEAQVIGVVGIVGGRGPIEPARPAMVNIAIAGVAGVEEIIWEAPPNLRLRSASSTTLICAGTPPFVYLVWKNSNL